MSSPRSLLAGLLNPFRKSSAHLPPRAHRHHSQLEPLEQRIAPAAALALSTANELLQFDTATPGTIVKTSPITGLTAGDNVVGIDFRPTTGELFALAQNGTTGRLYTLDPATGLATLRATLAADPGDATSPFTGLSGTSFGTDFNPVPDLAGNPSFRVTTDTDQNLRINVTNGLVTTDTDISPGGTNLAAVAYTNVDLDSSTGTTIFGYDFTSDNLVTSAAPNGGVYTVVGGSGVFATNQSTGFDIHTVNGVNTAFLTLAPGAGTASNLYTVNLTTGTATPIGAIGSGVLVTGLAIVPESVSTTLFAIDSGNNLIRFNAGAPSVTTTVGPVTGLVGGDAILGFDFRPTTGVAYLVGTTTLYTLDTATGAATVVASLTAAPGDDNPFTTFSGTAFGAGFNPVPDLAGNPSLRVIGNTGENLRVNVANGQVTTDTPITPPGSVLTAVAYANNDLDPATGTTIFAYEFGGDDLMTSANPNGGAYTDVSANPSGVVAIGADNVGFDIQTLPGSVNVGYLTLAQGAGTTGQLFTIDLVTGAATTIGNIGPAPTLLRSLAVAPAGSFAFSAPNYSVGESGPVATITVNRLGGSDGVATVQFLTDNGSANSPGDFTDSDQTLIFAPGVTSQVVTIPLNADAIPESDETVSLTLSNPTGGALLAPQSSATLTITNDDGSAANAFAVDNLGNLVRFNLGSPGVIVSSTPIAGLAGATILGLDFRPADNSLYALASSGQVFTIDQASAVATPVGSGIGALNGTSFGFDFNPTVDRIRVVSDADENFRINPNDGTLVGPDTSLIYDNTTADGDPIDVNVGADPNVVAVAYTNSVNLATTTTLYGIDSNLDILVIQNPPNNGVLNTVGALGVDVNDVLGFDIRDYGGIQIAYATLVVGGTPGLYTIDLTTGAASFEGAVGGPGTVAALAVAPSAFSASLAGTNAAFTGSTASDSITFDQSGGLLRHNRFTAGDLGFNSDFDFDSATPGDQTLSATDPAVSVIVNGGAADERVTIGTAAAPVSGIAAVFQINGEGGGDTLTLEDTATLTPGTIAIGGTVITGLGGVIVTGTLERVNLNAGSGGNTINVFATTDAMTSLNTGDGDDTVIFADGATLRGGLLDGGTGTNSLDYSSWTTSVNVDLSPTQAQTLFLATISGAQEPGPLSSSPASGLGVFTLNTAQNALTFNITTQGVTGTSVSGAHFHNAAEGVNGPIVRDLAAEQIDNTPPETELAGVWSSADAQLLTPALVTELLADRIYFNQHTTPNFPSGELRGQLINQGTVGLATGTGGARNFDNITGGSASDFLVAGTGSGFISGGEGDDTVGGGAGGDDFLFGNNGNDTILIEAGGGSLSVAGDNDSDTLDFSRAGTGINFDLDVVGTPQAFNASNTRVFLFDEIENLTGSPFNDVIRVDAKPFPRFINGGPHTINPPGDRLIVDALGQTASINKTDLDTGTVAVNGFASIDYDEVETVQLSNSPVGGGFVNGGNAFSSASLYTVGKAPSAVAIGDLTGDGVADMIVANKNSNSLSLLVGTGTGTFNPAISFSSGGKSPSDLAIGDLDGDLDLDIVVTNRSSKNVAVFVNPGNGAFGLPTVITTAAAPIAVALGDVNGDGDLDIAAVSTSGSKLSVVLSDGVGGFGAATISSSGGTGPSDVVIGDFDGDTNSDIVTLNKASQQVAYFAGNGTGNFATFLPERFFVGPSATALAVADFNNDGALDLSVNRGARRAVTMLLGNGAAVGAQFQAPLNVATPKPNALLGFGVADFNGDGNVDLALTSLKGDTLRVLLGLGSGLFGSVIEFDLGLAPTRIPTALATGDLNGDGVPDIALINTTSDISVLLRTPV